MSEITTTNILSRFTDFWKKNIYSLSFIRNCMNLRKYGDTGVKIQCEEVRPICPVQESF